MKIGWVGLGKLGLPCAAELALAGHDVVGYDLRTPLVFNASLRIADDLKEAVLDREVVFIAVQTPHAFEYGGTVSTPEEPRDFEYAYLAQALRDVCDVARYRSAPLTVAVVSTVLPGTFDHVLRPLLSPGVRYAYNPAFIRLEHVARDFRDPQLVLIGAEDPDAAHDVERVHQPLHPTALPVHASIPSAELMKVAYNTLLFQRIVFANALAEVCDGVGADVDEVTQLLGRMPEKIMSAGLGDGGPCRPRDVIAMSWLANRLGLAHDPWGLLVRAREAQTHALAHRVRDWHKLSVLPVVTLGTAYKPGTAHTLGSTALLLNHYLLEHDVRFRSFDPVAFPALWPPALDGEPALFVVGTPHESCIELEFPAGSVVIDPWRVVLDRPGVTVVRIGGGGGG